MLFTDIFNVMKKIYLAIFLTIISLCYISSEEITKSILNLYSSPTIITNIKAISAEKSIEIRFDNSRVDRELVIYRSTNPINNYNDLVKASLITTFISSDNIFIDYPLEGVPYFYLIMDSLLTKAGEYVIKKEQNVTTQSILIHNSNSYIKIENRGTLRNQPLPYLDLKSSIESGKHLSDSYTELPVKYNLTFESQNIVNNIVNNIFIKKSVDYEIVIFDSDMGTSSNSEEYQLKRILETDFRDKNWVAANRLLSNFLSVDHSKTIQNSAHFYLAQVLFFQNKYTDSFMEFTLIHDELPMETKPWMDVLLTYLKKEY